MDSENRILFYESEHYYLSNFSSFKVQWNDSLWPTSEHAYQACKFFEDGVRHIADEIFEAKSSHEALKIARREADNIRVDWDKMKLTVMKNILEAKLRQHLYIQKKLKLTLGKDLIENSHRDGYWGRGADWKGENHLGKLWVAVRDEFFN